MKIILFLFTCMSVSSMGFEIKNYDSVISSDKWDYKLIVYKAGNRPVITEFFKRTTSSEEFAIKVHSIAVISRFYKMGSNGVLKCTSGPILFGYYRDNAFELSLKGNIDNVDYLTCSIDFSVKYGKIDFGHGQVYKYRLLDRIDAIKFDEFYYSTSSKR